MSINTKKYTKDQMAKMVEEAAERLESLKFENSTLTEQLKSQTAKTIALRNDLMAKTHSAEELKSKNATLVEQISQMNGEAITRENEIVNLKADADALRNKLADTEAALGRANAELTWSVAEKNALRNDATKMWDRAAFELGRADYAENHPWRNLWAWAKRKLWWKK